MRRSTLPLAAFLLASAACSDRLPTSALTKVPSSPSLTVATDGAECAPGFKRTAAGCVDATSPVIEANVTGQLVGQWYVSDVRVTWTVADAQSTVRGIVGCNDTTITSDVDHISIDCAARSAGGLSRRSVFIRRAANAAGALK